MKLFFTLLACWTVQEASSFGPSFTRAKGNPVDTRRSLAATEDTDDEEEDVPAFEMGTVRVDDGGSNLTDRFKYKVHALMGDYDPVGGVDDTEHQDGNIMSALVTFPTQHMFEVVGRTSNEKYAEDVKSIVFGITGDDTIECGVIPRGTKFTKVQCITMVESTAMINSIYEQLGAMEATVMKF